MNFLQNIAGSLGARRRTPSVLRIVWC